MTALWLGMITAIILFWAVGAHNRLMRLRSAVRDQWLNIDAACIKLIAPLQGNLAAHLEQASAEEIRSRAEPLRQACDEMLDALTQAHQRALNADTVEPVLAAHQRLVDLTHQALSQDGHAAWPELVHYQLRMWQSLPAAVGQYHSAVQTYHDAIEAWPARWLARRTGLTRVRRLDEMVAGLELAP